MPPRPKAATRTAGPKKPFGLPTPDLPAADALTAYTDTPQDEGAYEYRSVTSATWGPDTYADHARFSQCLFTDVEFEGGTWPRTTFADVRLEDCRLIAPDMVGSHWRDAEVRRGIASGVQWIGADIRRVHFAEVKLDSVNFRDAQLTDVVFTDCLLREADFAGASLTRVRFPGCVFERAEFSHVTVSDVDFRGAHLSIGSGWESLRGAVIDSMQLVELAPAFAAHLGLTVSDDVDAGQ